MTGSKRIIALPSWLRQPVQCAELFALFNLAFLSLDIYLAHSINQFARPAEWIPFFFSIGGALGMMLSMALSQLRPTNRAGRRGRWAWVIGITIGVSAIVVGVAGLILHLNSQFFSDTTLKNLVYTAPFAAPLSYAGIGLLILLNRTVDGDSAEWSGWIVVLALGGFVGNFVLSLADHAQNGFWNASEWIPVIGAALAVGFLLLPVVWRVGRRYLLACFVVMALQMVIGMMGEAYHLLADLHGPARTHLIDNFIYGAPAFAPLLFANLALLGFIGLWPMYGQLKVNPSNDQIVVGS